MSEVLRVRNVLVALHDMHALSDQARQARRRYEVAVAELHATGLWSCEEIGALVGVTGQRAWQIVAAGRR